jgi:hypothetical protein
VGVHNLEIENLHQGHLPAAPDHGDIGLILLELARRAAPGLPASQLHARELSLADAGLTWARCDSCLLSRRLSTSQFPMRS